MATATPKAKAQVRTKMRIKKGDTVQVISGKDKGKTGEVLRTLPYENRVVVQGINLRTRHVKPTQEGETGRIVTEEASLHASNVMLYSTSKQVASRVEIGSRRTAPRSAASRRPARSSTDRVYISFSPTVPVRLLTKPRSATPVPRHVP